MNKAQVLYATEARQRMVATLVSISEGAFEGHAQAMTRGGGGVRRCAASLEVERMPHKEPSMDTGVTCPAVYEKKL